MSVLPRALTLAPREEPGPERQQREEIAWATDRDYWLSRCQGFAIEQGDDCVGLVDNIEYETRIDVPDFTAGRSSTPAAEPPSHRSRRRRRDLQSQLGLPVRDDHRHVVHRLIHS